MDTYRRVFQQIADLSYDYHFNSIF